jgi:hypothetical protein
VVTVKAGFAFIEVPGYPHFFCPGSKWRGVVLTRGLRVRFAPGFNARGAQAELLAPTT